MTAWASRADVVAHPQEGEELGSNILRVLLRKCVLGSSSEAKMWPERRAGDQLGERDLLAAGGRGRSIGGTMRRRFSPISQERSARKRQRRRRANRVRKLPLHTAGRLCCQADRQDEGVRKILFSSHQ
jgi:hypothetical protein